MIKILFIALVTFVLLNTQLRNTIKLRLKQLFCKHKNTRIDNQVYQECHGYHLCEYSEECLDCCKIREFRYGNTTKWKRKGR